MQTRESNSETDYIYYPINYRSKALTTLCIFNSYPKGNYVPWVILNDKAKFICGAGMRLGVKIQVHLLL